MRSDDYEYDDLDMMKSECEEPSLFGILKTFKDEAVWYDWLAFVFAIPFMVVFAIMMVPLNFIDKK